MHTVTHAIRDRYFPADVSFFFSFSAGAFLSSRPSPEVLSLLQTVRGTVLDLGPGSGDLLKYLSPSALTRVYGAEPAQLLHGKLRAHARDAGLEGKYSVLHCGAEPESLIPALAKAGVLSGAGEGVFDEICCVRVLCGVPRPAETVRGLYGLLKPGGRMVVHEHVVNPWREEDGSVASRVLQAVYSWVGWDFFLGCKIDRDTKALLLEAGGKDGWSKVELKSLMGWSVMPHCTGYLVKRE